MLYCGRPKVRGSYCFKHARISTDRAVKTKPWPQDAIDQEMIEQTKDSWKLK